MSSGDAVPTTAAAEAARVDDVTTTTERKPAPDSVPVGQPIDDRELVGYLDDQAIAAEAFELLRTLAEASPDEALTVASAEALGDAPILPAGAQVTIEKSTWERTGRIAAVVITVQLPDSENADEFVAYLIATLQGWRLSYTERLT